MTKTCAVPGCTRAFYGKGLCNMHYQRKRRYGDVSTRTTDRGDSIADRLRRRVREVGGCWEWTAGRDTFGYGRINHNGRSHAAHRLSYETFVGAIPAGVIVCHSCDNPYCINPEHLWLGTDADNSHDRDAKGRQISHRGEAHGMSVLTDQDVLEIRSLHAAGESLTSIARRFGVSRPNVGYIVKRQTWRHV